MNTPLEKRLAKIEASVMPKPDEPITVLTEPLAGASEEDRAAFEADLAEAKAAGVRIIVVREGAYRSEKNGIEYVSAILEAQLAVLASQRSEHGKSNKLVDLLDSLPGNVLGVRLKPERLSAG